MSDSDGHSTGDSEDGVIGELAGILARLVLEAQKNPPSKKYRCGVCKQFGVHFINDCPVAAKTGQRTPYQGKSRCFGQYQCKKCGRLWVSSRSWANTTQDCEKCDIAIYPHRQRPLHKPNGLEKVCNLDKSHPQELCGKCQQLGRACIGSALA